MSTRLGVPRARSAASTRGLSLDETLGGSKIIGMGNNPMVGASVAVAVEEAMRK